MKDKKYLVFYFGILIVGCTVMANSDFKNEIVRIIDFLILIMLPSSMIILWMWEEFFKKEEKEIEK